MNETADRPPRRVEVVGLGLVGGSIGMALRARGWLVHGVDLDTDRAARALELGAVDAVGPDTGADLSVVAVPVGAIAGEVARLLGEGRRLVTDVGSVKAPMLDLMADPRYVGGHPMAGSELEGVDGARADLFEGRTWVLTPVPGTDDDAFAEVRSIVSSLGAEVVALPPERHDAMVAVVSHVPHLTAASLMRLADERSVEHRALLRLAAGGFRDMTRIAAGHPAIWPDICAENRTAIVAELDRLISSLADVRRMVDDGDRDGLIGLLERARAARVALPAGVEPTAELAEVRVRIPDAKGQAARILTLATDLDISILDIEIAHSTEGPEGVLILLVERRHGDVLRRAVDAIGYVASAQDLA